MISENHNSQVVSQPLVSVIVPVYNVEKYIEKCVRTIMEQDHKNLEIILVDDGTKDSSGQIIDELAQQDHRIHVIHKENGGVATARNRGLDVATGEYIVFVDGDDYVEKEYVSYLVDLAEHTGCDMAVSRNHYSLLNKSQIREDHRYVASAERAIEDIYLMKLNEAVWNKLYRHDFLKEKGIRFNEQIWYGEGMLFNIECLQFVDKIAVGERRIYHQIPNPDSAMRKFNLESNFCGIRSLELQKEKWKKTNEGIEKAWVYHYRCFSDSILNGLVRSDMVREHREVYKKCIKNLRSDIMVPLRVDIPLKRKAYYLVAAVCPVILAKRNALKNRRERKMLAGK